MEDESMDGMTPCGVDGVRLHMGHPTPLTPSAFGLHDAPGQACPASCTSWPPRQRQADRQTAYVLSHFALPCIACSPAYS